MKKFILLIFCACTLFNIFATRIIYNYNQNIEINGLTISLEYTPVIPNSEIGTINISIYQDDLKIDSLSFSNCSLSVFDNNEYLIRSNNGINRLIINKNNIFINKYE